MQSGFKVLGADICELLTLHILTHQFEAEGLLAEHQYDSYCHTDITLSGSKLTPAVQSLILANVVSLCSCEVHSK